MTNEAIERAVQELEKLMPKTSGETIPYPQFCEIREFFRSTLTRIAEEAQREAVVAGAMRELKILLKHLNRQTDGFTSVSLNSLYGYIYERQKDLTPQPLEV